MEEVPLAKIDIPGWEGFNPTHWGYSAGKGRPKLEVILCNPTKEQAATWIISAVVAVKGYYDPKRATDLVDYINRQSSFQFPVSGLVDEGEDEDGDHGIFAFSDGIAVKLAKSRLPTRNEGTRNLLGRTFGSLIIKYALRPPSEDIIDPGAQARPSSITFNEFHNHLPRTNEKKPLKSWSPLEIRQIYQKALKSQDNPLITELLRTYDNGPFPE